MKIIAKKTSSKLLLTLELVGGTLISVGGMIILPVAMFSSDSALFEVGLAWIVVLAGMAFFALVGYFCSLRPFLLFRKLPEVQAETDGTYLYLHTAKEAKIPLSALKRASVDFDLPYIMSREFIIHLLSEQYGTVTIKVPRYGKYKLRFISRAQEACAEILTLAETSAEEV